MRVEVCYLRFMMKITKKTTIAEVLERNPKKASILQKHLHATCFGCPMSQQETLEEAAEHHNIVINKLLEELNKE